MRVHPDLCLPELLYSEKRYWNCCKPWTLISRHDAGPDGIAAKMLKSTASVIATSLTTLFNYSVMNGVVSDKWKKL